MDLSDQPGPTTSASSQTPVWFVVSTDPGLGAFLDGGIVAVNFHVRADATGLDAPAIAEAASGLHPTWDGLAKGVRTRFARQLRQFANEIDVGDQVVSFSASDRNVIHVGTVVGDYTFEDPASVDSHPHLREVDWHGRLDRDCLPESWGPIPRSPGITVKNIGVATDTSIALASPATRPMPRADRDPRPGSGLGSSPHSVDTFVSAPNAGDHRYQLTQTFGHEAEPMNPFTVVMLNPAANDPAGFHRSTTCRRVKSWGLAHGFDGARYLNLFSFIEPVSSKLADVPREQLNGSGADAAFAQHRLDSHSVVLAGWGNLPPGFDRSTYDERIAEVEELLGVQLSCLGFTQPGYPRHGRFWSPTDIPEPLRRYRRA